MVEQARDAYETLLRAKVTAWQTALDSYLAAKKADGPLTDAGATRGSSQDSGTPMDLPVGVFRDKKIPEAIEIFLRAGRRKQTNKEIATGLQKGGLPTTSANFEATVATALGRMEEKGIVLRFPNGWDLAASYPDSLRTRLGKDTKSKTRTKPNKAKPTKKSETTASEDKTETIMRIIAVNGGVSLGDILDVLTREGVEASRDYVRVVTKRLRRRGRIEIKNGKFYGAQGATLV